MVMMRTVVMMALGGWFDLMWGVSLLLTLVDCRWRAAGSTVRTLVLLWTAWVVFLLIALPLGRSHERQHERNGLCHANPI